MEIRTATDGRPRPPIHHFRRAATAFRLRPPAMDVAAARPFLAPPPSFGVTVPLPGASDAVPDPPSLSSPAPSGSVLAPLILAPSRLPTFCTRLVTRDRNHVPLIDGATAVSLSTGSRLPSGSS